MHHFDNFPPVPLILEGSSILHQIMRVRWPEWRALTAHRREELTRQAIGLLELMEKDGSALFSIFGHKGDVMLIHFRKKFEELAEIERELVRLPLWDYLAPATSYLSVVELGLYESTMKVYSSLAEKTIEPYTPEWGAEIKETLDRQAAAMSPRLYPEVPPHKFVCFYPMDRLRGETKNWYQLPISERQRQMAEHGEVGRRYAGRVKQIISGSIGLDNWEWGVDLFADDPVIFKHLIYEMRFDEVSAVYAKFGEFFIGMRTPAQELERLLQL